MLILPRGQLQELIQIYKRYDAVNGFVDSILMHIFHLHKHIHINFQKSSYMQVMEYIVSAEYSLKAYFT